MLTLVTGPVAPLLDTTAAKLHLRVDHTDEDALIDALVSAATSHMDGPGGFLGRALITQTIMAKFDCFPPAGQALRLACPPLQEVTEINYLDSAGAWQTLDPSAYRVVTSQSRRGFVEPAAGQTWPSDLALGKGVVEVTYKAGYGDTAADVPEALIQALRLLLGHFYENRELVITGTIATEIPYAVEALTSPFQVHF